MSKIVEALTARMQEALQSQVKVNVAVWYDEDEDMIGVRFESDNLKYDQLVCINDASNRVVSNSGVNVHNWTKWAYDKYKNEVMERFFTSED